jgi:hypothetical protein
MVPAGKESTAPNGQDQRHAVKQVFLAVTRSTR